MNTNLPILKEIVDLIVPLVEPDKIILFGSYARGEATEKSDVDIMVLKKGMGIENEGKTVDKIYYSYLDSDIDVSIDVLAMDYDRYLELNNVIGYVYKQIEKDGKVIYEASH